MIFTGILGQASLYYWLHIELPHYSYPYGDNPFAPSQPTTPNAFLTFLSMQFLTHEDKNHAKTTSDNHHFVSDW